MYLPAKDFLASRIGIQTEGDIDDPSGYEIVDAVVRWFVSVFEKLGAWFVEVPPKLGPWLAEAFSNLGSFVAEEYRKSLDFLMKVVHAANEPLKQHPYWSLFISLLVFFGPWILLLPLFLIQAAIFLLLNIVGFGAAGITEGSAAASFQSTVYGGHTPVGSLFAIFQSIGVRYNVGTMHNWLLLATRVIAGAVAAYIVFGILLVD